MKKSSPQAIVSVGAVILRQKNHKREILLVKRERYGSEWSLPKGKVKGEENLHEALAREMLEETGYTIIKGQYAGCVSYPVGADIKINLFWFATFESGNFKPNKEVVEIAWVSKEEAMRLLSYDELKKFLMNIMP